MKQKPCRKAERMKAKTVLRPPDLEFAKIAVLNSLTSSDAQRGYRHAIDEFVDWYCSGPRLAFNRIVLLRYGAPSIIESASNRNLDSTAIFSVGELFPKL